jgi:hypothetical protein
MSDNFFESAQKSSASEIRDKKECLTPISPKRKEKQS